MTMPSRIALNEEEAAIVVAWYDTAGLRRDLIPQPILRLVEDLKQQLAERKKNASPVDKIWRALRARSTSDTEVIDARFAFCALFQTTWDLLDALRIRPLLPGLGDEVVALRSALELMLRASAEHELELRTAESIAHRAARSEPATYEPAGPDSFGGTDEESHYAAPALVAEMQKAAEERLETPDPGAYSIVNPASKPEPLSLGLLNELPPEEYELALTIARITGYVPLITKAVPKEGESHVTVTYAYARSGTVQFREVRSPPRSPEKQRTIDALREALRGVRLDHVSDI